MEGVKAWTIIWNGFLCVRDVIVPKLKVTEPPSKDIDGDSEDDADEDDDDDDDEDDDDIFYDSEEGQDDDESSDTIL